MTANRTDALNWLRTWDGEADIPDDVAQFLDDSDVRAAFDVACAPVELGFELAPPEVAAAAKAVLTGPAAATHLAAYRTGPVALLPGLVAIAAMLVAFVSVGTFMVPFPSEKALELVDFDEIEFEWEGDEPEFVVLEDPEVRANGARTPTASGTKERRVKGVEMVKAGSSTKLERVVDNGELGKAGSGGLDLSGLGGTVMQRNAIPNFVLEDDHAIIQMAARVIHVNGRGLGSCHQQGLLQDESLRGRWVAEFTIQTNGRPNNVKITPDGGTNADMEACMVHTIETWQFQKIYKPLPVRKTFRFQPG